MPPHDDSAYGWVPDRTAPCREQFFPQRVSLLDPANGPHERGMHTMLRQHWLDYDPVALAVLVIGLAIVELLALSI